MSPPLRFYFKIHLLLRIENDCRPLDELPKKPENLWQRYLVITFRPALGAAGGVDGLAKSACGSEPPFFPILCEVVSSVREREKSVITWPWACTSALTRVRGMNSRFLPHARVCMGRWATHLHAVCILLTWASQPCRWEMLWLWISLIIETD